jgi:hypothetical protein
MAERYEALGELVIVELLPLDLVAPVELCEGGLRPDTGV